MVRSYHDDDEGDDDTEPRHDHDPRDDARARALGDDDEAAVIRTRAFARTLPSRAATSRTRARSFVAGVRRRGVARHASSRVRASFTDAGDARSSSSSRRSSRRDAAAFASPSSSRPRDSLHAGIAFRRRVEAASRA